ncbi:hypothetical protein F6Y05_00205 [Bacillus megaterium]|nr:hypothetical protein [Priestia megaterium]
MSQVIELLLLFFYSLRCIYPLFNYCRTLTVACKQKAKKFNVFYLIIYCVVAIIFLYVSYKIEGGISTPIFRPDRMVIWATGAGIIYWIWDSVVMQKDEYPYY